MARRQNGYIKLKDPLVIMCALPLAVIGALIALYLSGDGFTMVGVIGLIFLLGLVTKNAILLIDFVKRDGRMVWTAGPLCWMPAQ